MAGAGGVAAVPQEMLTDLAAASRQALMVARMAAAVGVAAAGIESAR